MKKKCYACKKFIDLEKDRYVLLGTYKEGKAMEENYYHFQCWIDFFNQKIIDRIALGQDKAMKMLAGSLKNLKVNIQ